MAQVDFGGLNKVYSAPPGAAWTLSATTGTMAAGLGAGAATTGNIFIMRTSTVATNLKAALISRIRLQWSTIAAFSAPIETGRYIALYKFTHPSGSGNGLSTGGASVVPLAANAADTSSVFAAVNATPEWAEVRIATTETLVFTGTPTVAATPLRIWSLSHLGAAGANGEVEWTFPIPIFLPNGAGIVLRNGPNALTAGGTWNLNVAVDWNEVGTST